MRKIRIPGFCENLFRDLRDRRLLLPAIALAVALAAVPIVLKNHSSSSPAPAPVSGSGAAAEKAVPAVVTRQLGVTNYHKRLDRLNSKNPFRQQYTATPQGSQLQATSSGTSTSGTSSTITSTSSTSTTSTTGSVPPVSSSTSSGGTSPTPSPPTTSSGGSNSAAPHHQTNPGVRYYAWRVSVKVGEPGHLKARTEVQRMALLPSDGKPVLSFLGASEDGSKAVFLVNSSVDSVDGDGHCLPSHSSCQFFTMKPGDKAHFHYAPNNTRYNLVLVDIHPVDVTDKLPKKSAAKAEPEQKLPILGDG